MDFVELFGETVQGKEGDVDVSTFKELDTVGLYFSAHWCGPCRGFTPQLAKKYEELKKDGKKFEIVFVSSDRTQKAFDDYYKEQPWLALKFGDRKRKAKLSKKFKVQGIPTLVFIDPATGEANDEGRAAIMGQGQYPFKPIPKPKFEDFIKEAKFISQDGKESTIDDVQKAGNKYLMLYFSAHWCPPCRGFTPLLKKWYTKNKPSLNGGDRQFECVFVSSDQDESTGNSYFKDDHGDYLKLDYSQRDLKSTISDHFGVRGIPSLCVVDLATGRTITDKGRGGVSEDTDAKDFPWAEKPIDYLGGSNIANVNEFPMLIVFADNENSDEQKEAALKACTPAAERVFKKAEESGDDAEMKFAVEKGTSGFGDRLRDTLGFKKGEQVVAIFNLGDRKGFFSKDIKSMEDVTEEKIDAFVNLFLDEDNRESTLDHKDMKL